MVYNGLLTYKYEMCTCILNTFKNAYNLEKNTQTAIIDTNLTAAARVDECFIPQTK